MKRDGMAQIAVPFVFIQGKMAVIAETVSENLYYRKERDG